MPQLSLSWLGLGLEAASPWLLLLLVGASWLLARVLTRIYACYENSRRLQCFPQPPQRSWLLGHLGLVSVTAVRAQVDGLVRGRGVRGSVWAWSSCHAIPSLAPIPVLSPLVYFGFVSFISSPYWCTHGGTPEQAGQTEAPWCPTVSSAGLQAF